MARDIYGLIGHPVEHSLSPAMQNAAFEAFGMDAEYRVFDIVPEDLDRFLSEIAANDIRGINITIPHKIKAREYVEKRGTLDPNARKLGAINTIRMDAGKAAGFNTDGPGFYRSLVEDLRFEPEGKDVFVLGAGGASRAVIMYLGNGPRKICVYDVDAAKARDLMNHYAEYYDSTRLEVIGHPDRLKSSLDRSHLLVNATPVGMNISDPSPIDKELLHPGLFVYDLVYNRPATQLVNDATRLKLHAVTGLGMLLFQGAIAFEIWTGRKAPVDAMRRALKGAVKRA